MGNSSSQIDQNAGAASSSETPPHIKRVSRIKHRILQQYLPVWSRILGSANERLCYFDCYAGPGRYELGGHHVDGSPIIAVKAAKAFVSEKGGRRMTVALMERDENQSELLRAHLKRLEPYPDELKVFVLAADSSSLVSDLLAKSSGLAPSFFMIDPYGHPLSVPLINQILERPRTEALINLMWYRINMNLGNQAVQHLVDELFDDRSWRDEPFMRQTGAAREEGFLSFFCSRVRAKYILPFRIGFDEEDKVRGQRTKYYLLHASNHSKAALLMKEVMWPLGDKDGTFDFSGEAQGVLISKTPQQSELQNILLREFAAQRIGFDELRERTWKLPFIEKHYRSVLQTLRKQETVTVTPVTSKKSGLKGRDLIEFPPAVR